MESTRNNKLEAALKYASMGHSVMPWGKGKNSPLLSSWTEYQTRRAREDEIRAWWSRWPNANVALITGKVSGLFVLDLDKKYGKNSSSVPHIPPTACAKSGNGGEHFYFKYPGYHVKSTTDVDGPGVDIRGDGGFIILPPSVTDYIDEKTGEAAGGPYEWIVPLEDGVAVAPQWLLQMMQHHDKQKKYLSGRNGVGEGDRNDTAASMAGKIFSKYQPQEWDTVGWGEYVEWNKKNTPPLEDGELKTVWESIRKYHPQDIADNGKPNIADKIVEMVLKSPDVLLFRNEHGDGCIQFRVGDHLEYWPFKDKNVKLWVGNLFYEVNNKTVPSDSLGAAINTLQGRAVFRGPQFPLSVRTAEHNGDIYYSLSNDQWEAVRVTKSGWEIDKNPPILFRRYSHQQQQVTPEPGGDLWKIFDFVNLKHEDDKIIFLVWLVSCFVPNFPHPILYLYGPQGSAKSTTSRILKKIIDPSRVEVSEIPRDPNELIQKMAHHWFLVFDNTSYIGGALSDVLCRAVTGSGFAKRELYTDDNDVIYTFRRCLSINGINLLASKPDLLERSVIIELDRVTKDRRRNEQDLYAAFDAELPRLLGAAFTAAAGAMRIREGVSLPDLPRMADFTVWGYSIAEAIGYGGKRFLDAYYRSLNQQNTQAIDEDAVATFVVELMDQQPEWEGTATDLLKLLSDGIEGSDKRYDIPKSPNELSRRLNILKTTLADTGIVMERKQVGNRKLLRVAKKVDHLESSSPTPQDAEVNDGNNF